MKGERVLNRNVNRRELLHGGAGLAVGLGMAGCGVGSSSGDKKATEKKVARKVDGDLVYFNWAEYIDPKLIEGFEKRYGVKVRQSNFDSMSGMMAKLRAGIPYDITFPTADYAQRLISANQLLRIDRDALKNADTVYDAFSEPSYDPGSAHTTPYTMYATGLGYRSDKVSGLAGSWKDLGTADSGGRSFMLDDFQESVGMAHLANGVDLNSSDPADLEKARAYLVALKPKLRGISSDTITNMTGGSAYLQHLWNGDIVNIRNQVDNPEDFRFQKCSEGVPVGSDVMAIPVNAKHPGTALLFIDYMLEPENAARNVEWIGYPMPYEGGATEAFQGLVKDDPSIAVTVEDLENGQQFDSLVGEARRAWNRTWTEARAA